MNRLLRPLQLAVGIGVILALTASTAQEGQRAAGCGNP